MTDLGIWGNLHLIMIPPGLTSCVILYKLTCSMFQGIVSSSRCYLQRIWLYAFVIPSLMTPTQSMSQCHVIQTRLDYLTSYTCTNNHIPLLMRFQPLEHLLKRIILSLLNLGIFILP